MDNKENIIGIQAPCKYIQGPGLIDSIGEHVSYLGNDFLILIGETMLSQKKDAIAKSMDNAGLRYTFLKYCGEVTKEACQEIAEYSQCRKADSIIGIGGGKLLDAGKSAAAAANAQFVSVPSIAASDAACSSLSVLYDRNGNVDFVEYHKTNPSLVIVDSRIIANAPIRTFVSGIGDALSTYFEARTCYKNGYKNPIGYNISYTAFSLAHMCYDLILDKGIAAIEDINNHKVTRKLEDILEATIYLSGIGFESGGLSSAHALQNALVTIPECRSNTMHGERVAFGTICLLILENEVSDLYEVVKFCKEAKLPVTLNDLNINSDVDNKIKEIAYVALEKSKGKHNYPPGTTVKQLYSAIKEADQMGSEI